MKKKLSRWFRLPFVFGAFFVLGWAITSAVVQRRISAAWHDLPTRRVSMYPTLLGRGVEVRISKLTKSQSLRDFSAWLAELATQISPDHLRAALDAVRGLPEDWRTLAAETALARLAHVDPQAALDYALARLGDGSAGWNALANVLRTQVASNPAAMRRYLPAVARQLAFGKGGVAALAMLSPDESLGFIRRWHLPLDHPGVQECLQGAIDKLAKDEPERALQAIEEFKVKIEGPWRAKVWLIVGNWAERAPETALPWIQQHGADPIYPFAAFDEGRAVEAFAVGTLARNDPQILLDWLRRGRAASSTGATLSDSRSRVFARRIPKPLGTC